jgi:rRNA processing protein Krr1/Pno1
MPKMEDTPAPVDEDDDLVDVVVEGNPIAIAMARRAIAKIANERIATVNTKLRTIPAEFYPFIAGPHNTRANALEEAHGVQIRVPPYHTWTAQRPPQQPLAGHTPAFLPAAGDNHISLAGDRAAVQAARAEIELLTQELRQQLALRQISVDKPQHQYVIGERGITAQDFFAATGCAIVIPGPADEEMITFIGPADQLEAAENHALDLATSMQQGSVSIARQGNREHARNITQYLQDRKEIERLEKLHQFHIATPPSSERADTWNIFFRDGKTAIRARTEISSIVDAHPPSRVSTVEVDPFFHAHLRKDISPRVKRDYGVHLVVPEASDSETPVILVFEGESGLEPEYQVPRGHPSPEEIKAFQQGLQDARSHILEILSKQAQIISTAIDVPQMYVFYVSSGLAMANIFRFHEKLRKFIFKEQQARSADQIPVRVTSSGTVVTLRGPAPAVEALAAKVNAFVEQAKEDEKERDFTLSFDFPQKHANQLIGKGGSNIRDLRDRFDVEINVNDGTVELKGPKAKAEAAKSHISSLGRQWADEATYVLKVDPKYHRELIGAQGAQINKLQTRYKVQIYFPRSAKPVRDDQSSADAASEAGRRGPRREQEPDEVIVKGPKKGADEARDEILSLLQYYKDNSHTAVVAVQAGQIPSLIGKSGSGMDEIRQSTGARIDIPNARDSKDPSARVEIQIKGTKAQVAQAKKLIEEKRDVFDQTVTKTLEVDKKYHRALIGAGG